MDNTVLQDSYWDSDSTDDSTDDSSDEGRLENTFLDNQTSIEDKWLDLPFIHLRVRKRTTRKSITIVEGIEPYISDIKELSKIWKKLFAGAATVKHDKATDTKVVQLQGDVRKKIYDYLLSNNITSKEKIKLHGY